MRQLDQYPLDKPTMSIGQLIKKYNTSKSTIINAIRAGIEVELEHTSDRNIAKEIAMDHIGERLDYYTQLAKIDEVNIDNVNGIGSVPDNQNVDYLGIRVLMKPSKYLKLANFLSRNQATSVDFIKSSISSGKGIGAPWLVIKIPYEWNNQDYSTPAKVTSHEGRNRMYSVLELEGDNPIEVHIFFSNGLRNRDIKQEWIDALNKQLIPQGHSAIIPGPWFKITSNVRKESLMQNDLDEVYDGQSSGRLKNYIKKKYGGDITCRKVSKLINNPDVNNFYKKRAKWYKSLHCKGNKQVREDGTEESNENSLTIFNFDIDKPVSDKIGMIKQLLSYKNYSNISLYDDEYDVLEAFLKLKLEFPEVTFSAIPMNDCGDEGNPIIV